MTFQPELGLIMLNLPFSEPAPTATSPLCRFDMRAFHAALDAARQAKRAELGRIGG
jgi:hypothetical protein